MAVSDMSSCNPLALDNQVCFLLYSASRAVTAAYRPYLAELGLTYPQYLVMLVLWEACATEGEPGCTTGQLCQRLRLDTGTITPLLKRLESAGLVVRGRLPGDERVVWLRLTPEGVRLRERACAIPVSLSAKLGLGLEELDALRAMLSMLERRLLAGVPEQA